MAGFYYLLIAGSRTFNDRETFDKIVAEYMPAGAAETVIVEGGAKGADTMARDFARENGMNFSEFKPKWSKYGKAAGPFRNVEMIEFVREHGEAELGGSALFFWDGKSRGTAQCIREARKLIPVRVWNTVEEKYMEEAEEE